MPNPESKSGYAQCACCKLPIAVTADDVGLTVTCPRTGQLVAVKETHLNRGPLPVAKHPIPARQPSPSSPAGATARPARGLVKPAPQLPAGPPRNQPAHPATPHPERKRPNLLNTLILGVSVILGGVAVAAAILHVSRPELKQETARSAEQKPGSSPPAVVAPATPPAPTPGPGGGPVAPPVRPAGAAGRLHAADDADRHPG